MIPTKRTAFSAALFSIALLGLTTSVFAEGQLTVAQAIEASKSTGKPILVVYGSKT